MGEYSNPTAYIDTQSGQHYRNLQETITNATINTLGAVAAKAKEDRIQAEKNKKENEALSLKVAEEASALNRNVLAADQASPGKNFENLYRPYITKYAELRTKVLNGTSGDPSFDRMEADRIFASVGNIKNLLVDLSSLDTNESWEKRDSPGGMSTEFNDPKLVNAVLVAGGKLRGKVEPVFRNGNVSDVALKISDENGNFLYELTAEQLKKAANGSGLLKIIPNAADSVDNTKLAASNIFDAKEGKLLGTVKPDYLIPTIEERQVGGDTVLETAQGRKVVKEVQPFRKINKTKIETDPNFDAVINAKVAGIINSSDDNAEAMMFWNKYLATKEDCLYNTGDVMSEDDKIKFKERYKKFIIDGLPEYQAVGEAVKREDFVAAPKSTTNRSTNTSNEIKLTEAEKNAKKIIEAANKGTVDKLHIGGETFTMNEIDGKWIGNKGRVLNNREEARQALDDAIRERKKTVTIPARTPLKAK